MMNKKEYNNPIQKVLAEQDKAKRNKRNLKEVNNRGDDYIDIKLNQRIKEKKILATYIVERYIRDLFAVAVDAGSTQQQIIERIMEKRNYVSILTNNMTAFRQNSNQRVNKSANEFILTGGKYVTLFDALHGEETLNSFEVFNPNVVIIGVSGLVADRGFLCHGNDEVKAKRLLFNKNFSTIIIPVDHNKLGKMDSYSFGTLSDFRSTEDWPKHIVACPPIPPISEEEEEEYRKNKISFEKQIERIKDSGVMVDIVPDDYLKSH